MAVVTLSVRYLPGFTRLLKKQARLRAYEFQNVRNLFTTKCVHQLGVTSTVIPEIQEMCPTVSSHRELYQFSLDEPDVFWGTLARSRLSWYRDFHQVLESDMESGHFRWFDGGQLNVSVNCVDRHYHKTPNRVALIWEKDEPGQEERVTYRQLYQMMNQVGNALRSQGVKKGDHVAIYMPVSSIAVAVMLACARIGAIHSVVFSGFSAEALASRLQDAGAETIITADQAVRGGKIIELKKVVDAAVKKCPNIKRVFYSKRTGNEVPVGKIDIALEKAMASESTECEPAVMNSEDYLFLLYTSGSTGKPKGLVHTQAGYLLYAAFTHKHVFDYTEGDVFGCVADIGWITGHSYVVYGPLANGATTVLFESTPTYPDPGRYWKTVQRLKINQFYGAPTAIRLLLRYGDNWVKKYDRSTLKVLGSVGEPINHEAWHWYNDLVGDGKCTIVDTWWQTETGGIMISPRPSSPEAVIKPGMAMRPMFGIDPVIMAEKGNILHGNDVSGALCIKRPWPGIARTIYGDHSRYVDTYFKPFPGSYFSGDGGHRDVNGHIAITGRMDDVINVTGHRLGTFEVEDAMDDHPDVAETAVVGFPHDVKGEGVYAYVVLKEEIQQDTTKTIKDLRAVVRQKIAGYAVPEYIQICPGLPKTRSGKIMRRILRKVAANRPDELGDISTLADPSVVAVIIKNHETLIENMKSH